MELWPVALLEVTQLSNITRFNIDGRLSLSHFAHLDAIFNINDKHTFSCPTYALNSILQSRLLIPKWDLHIRVGIYAGKSPFYTKSILLIMNISTSLISPQFHCIYDDNFTMINAIRRGIEPPNWNKLACSSTSTSS